MKPIFTIHEGEFLVGDHINRTFTQKFEVWVPTKDSGVDLLVTRTGGLGKPVRLQVKFSRSFDIHQEMIRHVVATSWYTLDPQKIRKSRADLWVFVILTLRHDHHFVVIPTRELLKRIPKQGSKKWNLYLWVYANQSCYQVRDLTNEERLGTPYRGVKDRNRDFSNWLENWKLLDKFSK
jgi:hypothetical protein